MRRGEDWQAAWRVLCPGHHEAAGSYRESMKYAHGTFMKTFVYSQQKLIIIAVFVVT